MDPVAVVDPGVPLAVVDPVAVVDPGVPVAVALPVLGADVVALGDEVVGLGVLVVADPLEPMLPAVVPPTPPLAVVDPVAGTPLEFELAGTMPAGQGFAVVAPPATEPVVPVPGLVVVDAPTPLLTEPDDWVEEPTLAGVPNVDEVLAGVPVGVVVPVVVLCGVVVEVLWVVEEPTSVAVPTEVGVPIEEVPAPVDVVPGVAVVPVVPGVAVVPAAPVGVLMVPPAFCATTQQERARTVVSKRMLRVRM